MLGRAVSLDSECQTDGHGPLPGDPKESQDECEAWLRLSEQKLERAYGDDEPDYSGFLRRTPTMQEGDVLLTPIPQADGQVKTVPPFFSEKCLLIKVY